MAKATNTPIVVPETVRRKAGFRAGQPVEFRVTRRAITIVPKETVTEAYPLRRAIRKQLVAAYRANAERDLATAAAWFPVDEEAWERLEHTVPGSSPKRTPRHS